MPAIELGIEEFNTQSRKLMELINNLRDLGAHFDLEIPGIIVCGNQSAGKSSVIEGITKVPLPRADGTCTRCPIEVRMEEKEGSRWKCNVTIRKEFDANGQRLDKPEELKFGKEMFNFGSVAGRIERAQVAIVNPSKKVEDILRLKDLNSIENEIKFSENVVCVSIVGPDVGNLTLADLPGLIQATSAKEEERFIVMIENLVKKYARNERNVIVECITCKDDIENQKMHTLARDFDPEGVRTVGVLTKIDTIEEGCHGKWIEVLNGSTHSLNHGYFAVRNPSKTELNSNISFQAARELEEQAFKEHPWDLCQVDTNRYGINHLKSYLSLILSNLIKKSLPEIEKEIMTRLMKNKEKLASFQTPVHSPLVEFSSKLTKLSQTISLVIQNQSDLGLWKHQEVHYNKLRDSIRTSLPLYEGFDDEVIDKLSENHNRTVYDIDDVQKLIVDSRGRHVGGLLNVNIADKLKKEVAVKWRKPSLICLQKITAELKSFYIKEIETQFSSYPQLVLFAKRQLNELLNELEISTETVLLKWLDVECRMMYSLNTSYMEKCRKDILGALTDFVLPAHNSNELSLHNYHHSQKSQPYTTQLQAVLEESRKQRIPPHKREAAELMAYSKAYLKIAYKRVVDVIVMVIESELVFNFSIQLESKVFEWIQSSLKTISDLMEQDESIIQERQILTMERDRLHSALTEIQNQ